MSDWKNVQYKDGKMRTGEGGGTVTDVQVDSVSVVNQQGVAEIPAIPDGLHHYSTTEQVVGTWIDGKPVYEKTISLGALSYDANWHEVEHGISNIDNVIDIFGNLYSVTDDQFIPFPNYRVSTSNGITIKISKTKVIYINNWYDASNYAYITLQYTKTTDQGTT